METNINNTSPNSNDSSGANSVLLAIILVVIVGLAVWYFTVRHNRVAAPAETGSGLNVQVNMPTGGSNNTPPADTTTGSGSTPTQ